MKLLIYVHFSFPLLFYLSVIFFLAATQASLIIEQHKKNKPIYENKLTLSDICLVLILLINDLINIGILIKNKKYCVTVEIFIMRETANYICFSENEMNFFCVNIQIRMEPNLCTQGHRYLLTNITLPNSIQKVPTVPPLILFLISHQDKVVWHIMYRHMVKFEKYRSYPKPPTPFHSWTH